MLEVQDVQEASSYLLSACHLQAFKAGWWTDLNTGESLLEKDNVPEKLMLIVSEIAEAMEGHRKNLMDPNLPTFKNVEVELADAVIRIFDLAGAKGYRIHDAIHEKLIYNASRPDHNPENRRSENGKKY
jgi:NTP pyrophosphatase (non-canonical NTP hydrolase)